MCDLGRENSDVRPNACRTDCKLSWCGDAVIDTGEQCDTGPLNSNNFKDRCRTNCRAPFCGDGVIDTGEGCDDSNLIAGDGCASCQIEPETNLPRNLPWSFFFRF
jgi:cysteine-rich repeat protein